MKLKSELRSNIDRRDFLKTGAAVATASLLPRVGSAGISGSIGAPIDRSALAIGNKA